MEVLTTANVCLEWSSSLPLALLTVSLAILIGGLYKFLWKIYEIYPKDELDDVDGIRNYSSKMQRLLINEKRKNRQNSTGVANLPRLYPNGWFIIFESLRLKPGQKSPITVFGMNLVLWRGTSGQVYLTDAYCPHMGTDLGVSGEVKGECVRCPFHGWEIRGDSQGQMSVDKIPYSTTSVECLPIKKTRTKRILERNQLIYMWHHAEGEEPSWYPKVIPEIERGEIKYRGAAFVHYEGHGLDFVENVADVIHVDILHGTRASESLCWYRPFTFNVQADVPKQSFKLSPVKGEEHIAIQKIHSVLELMTVGGKTFPLFGSSSELIQEGPGTLYTRLFHSKFASLMIVLYTTPVGRDLIKSGVLLYSSRLIIPPIVRIIQHAFSYEMSKDIVIFARKRPDQKYMLTKEETDMQVGLKFIKSFYSHSSKSRKDVENTNPMSADGHHT